MNFEHFMSTTIKILGVAVEAELILYIDGQVFYSNVINEDVICLLKKEIKKAQKRSKSVSQGFCVVADGVAWEIYTLKNRFGVSSFVMVKAKEPKKERHIDQVIHILNVVLDDVYKKKIWEENISRLTKREREVFLYLVKGYRNKEIADTLHLSEYTIKNHIDSILNKLDAKSRLEVIAKFA
ncbi:response regulator transcription factor [Anoxybacillus ayderensis]|uniref:response regulator transcription factor n=1 Tax=Anoxybacillus ayderensis TaxID=265546 RepID=UPI002E230263|nr:LuxR C-terminal-related transcriptional regulator [Anoxybacillus ayderensis]MED0687208.1 LuxR C-terminal-related transcriptional regulator [Anoxybacillus ayderensis]